MLNLSNYYIFLGSTLKAYNLKINNVLFSPFFCKLSSFNVLNIQFSVINVIYEHLSFDFRNLYFMPLKKISIRIHFLES